MSHYVKATKKTFSKNAQECLIQPLMRQRETGDLCDIMLSFHGKHFNAHKSILALWSPYFHSMFTCDMKEKSIEEVDLSYALALEQDSVFQIVLDYMYTGSLPLSTDTVADVVKIADFLLLDDVRDFCQQFLLDLGNLELSNCLKVRFLAEDHNLPDVASAATNIIEARFHDYLIHHDDVLDLPWELLLKLLKDPCVVQHTGYNELKRLANRWIDYDRISRTPYHSPLFCAINVWISDFANEASYLGRELRSSLEGHETFANKNSDSSSNIHIDYVDNLNLQNSYHNFCDKSFDPDYLVYEKSKSPKSDKGDTFVNDTHIHTEVLFAIVCNQGLKFMKLFLYSLKDQSWFNIHMSGGCLLKYVPMRQTVCNMIGYEGKLYMYLCSSFPYPTDMLKINILSFDLLSGQPQLLSFKTVDYYKPTYRTTLTNYRSAPPSMVMCNGQLFIVGNKEGTGHLFACNFANNQYICYQIPGSRFISLARAVVRNDRQIFIWYRHRTGPSEEFSIKKSLGFVLFDAKMKIFSSWELPAPDISYDEFAKSYTMCMRDDTVHIYQPGDPALVLDEVRVKWVTSLRKITTPGSGFVSDVQAYGYQIAVPSKEAVLVLNNWQPYTTSLHEVSEKFPCAMAHIPPPIDNISVACVADLPRPLLHNFHKCNLYDEAYANALHVAMQYSDGDTEDSTGSILDDGNSDNDNYEYDEDLYDYEYDIGSFES